MSTEINATDKAKFIRVLAETDQIRMVHTERHCYFFATETGAKMLELLGVGVNKSMHAGAALRNYEFGDFAYSVSAESLRQNMGPFAMSDTLSKVIKEIPTNPLGKEQVSARG